MQGLLGGMVGGEWRMGNGGWGMEDGGSSGAEDKSHVFMSWEVVIWLKILIGRTDQNFPL